MPSTYLPLNIGACSSDRDNRAQVANLYYVVVAEILTDILSMDMQTSPPPSSSALLTIIAVMALPITFVHRVTFLDRKLLIRTMGIFSVGIVCIIIALCRGITIGISESWGTPTFPWIVLWEMIEGGISMSTYLSIIHLSVLAIAEAENTY